MNLKEQIQGYCLQLGLDCIGFTKCRKFEELRPLFEDRKAMKIENEFEESDIEKRINPFIYMSQGKTIISIAFPYLFCKEKSEDAFFSKYTWGKDYHDVVNLYLEKISLYIRSLGANAEAFVDSNALPERYIAYLCGLGFIGRNNMLITEKYGSYVFLGEIVTDLDIAEDSNEEEAVARFQKIKEYSKCGTCNRCYSECPTKSINAEKNNCNICLSYITQKKHIEKKWFTKLEGRIFGCDSCQDCCPYNEKALCSTVQQFMPSEYMIKTDINELINIDNSVFKEKYKNKACGWRGKNIIQRNALIAAVNKGHCIEAVKINSEYVQHYFDEIMRK